MTTRKAPVLLICVAVGLSALLFVLLFIAPKTKPAQSAAAESKPVPVSNASVEVYLNMAQKTLEPGKKKQAEAFAAAKQYDSLAALWNGVRRPDLGAYYAEQGANASNKTEDWLKAGNRYYYAIQFIEDKSEVPVLYQSAMRCFSKVLAIDPKNADAKIMLASCYVEGTQSPMDGITLLREVEQTDSNNVKLQLAFAFFSVKSGQLDKAIGRFNKALKADSTYIEAYLHLADAYEQMGQTEKTIEALRAYSARTPDVTSRLEIDKYILQLKSNTNK